MSAITALRQGDLFKMEGRHWLVSYVNESRARCIPLTPSTRKFSARNDDTGETEDVTVSGSGKAINISPNAIVDMITEEDLTEVELDRLADMYLEMGDAEGTAEGKGVSIDMAKSKIPVGKSKKGVGAKREAKPKVMSKCLCGCGEMTAKSFFPGHDSRFKGWLISLERGTETMDSLSAQARKALSGYTFHKNAMGGITPTKNYKGEPHTGYVKAGSKAKAKKATNGSGKKVAAKAKAKAGKAPSKSEGVAALPV